MTPTPEELAIQFRRTNFEKNLRNVEGQTIYTDVRLGVKKLGEIDEKYIEKDSGLKNFLALPRFDYYNFYPNLLPRLGFKINSIFRHNLPKYIDDLIRDETNGVYVHNDNIHIYFHPQSYIEVPIEDRGPDGGEDYKHLIFKPHLVFMPSKNNNGDVIYGLTDGVDNININSKVQIFAQHYRSPYTTPETEVKTLIADGSPDVLIGFHKPSNVEVHGGLLSWRHPQIINLKDHIPAVLYSIVNDINGENTEFHITLHGLLDYTSYNLLSKLLQTVNNFEELLNTLNSSEYQILNLIKEHLNELLSLNKF